MILAFVATLLLAQAQPVQETPPPGPQAPAAEQAAQGHQVAPGQGEGIEPASPVQQTETPSASPRGVTLGEQHAAPSAAGEGHDPVTASESAERAETPKPGVAEYIFHHVTDEVWLPIRFEAGGRLWDISITKHVVNMWIGVGALLLVLAIAVGRRSVIPKGLYSLVEVFVVFVRDEIAEKNIGHHGHLYVPYLCTAFFFILFVNVCGLLPLPFISTATGNISVTVVLALFTFFMTQLAGMRAQGAVGYWVHLVPAGVPKWLWPIMLPVEILGLFTKPFALTVRLFANMVAGHIVIFFLLALTVLLSVYMAPVSVAFALGIFLLELFVSLVQAYVFTMLSALFIGMTQHAH